MRCMIGSTQLIVVNAVVSSRGAQIRTGDPLLPKQVRYRTAPRPELDGKLVISEGSGRSLSQTHTTSSIPHPQL